MADLKSLLNPILPKKKQKKGGLSHTGTYNPQNPTRVLTVPQFREHLQDIFNDRTFENSRDLVQALFKSDPDMSAAVNAYLTLANTPPMFFVRTPDGELDPEGAVLLRQVLNLFTYQTDYTQGFQLKQSLRVIAENLRYMLLLRGGCAAELVVNDVLAPESIRVVDIGDIRWYETKPGVYKPKQDTGEGEDKMINLDIPSFFISFFHRDPNEIYPNSSFIAAINTIAARQTVINELYRILQVTGFPRVDLSVVEEVITKSAPADVKADSNKLRIYINERIDEIRGAFASIRSDQAFVHTDSVEAKIINEKNPGAAIPIEEVINVLNAQNQAALKTMATIIGRGESGVNTASVEARVFAMNADELNHPVAELLSRLLTFCLHILGRPAYVECRFRPCEMRPLSELEPQLLIRQQRLLQDLSHGIITDEEYTVEMHGRAPNKDAPELSGTGFMDPVETSVDTEGVTPNSDPMGRSLASPGRKASRSNSVKSNSSRKT